MDSIDFHRIIQMISNIGASNSIKLILMLIVFLFGFSVLLWWRKKQSDIIRASENQNNRNANESIVRENQEMNNENSQGEQDIDDFLK